MQFLKFSQEQYTKHPAPAHKQTDPYLRKDPEPSSSQHPYSYVGTWFFSCPDLRFPTFVPFYTNSTFISKLLSWIISLKLSLISLSKFPISENLTSGTA